MAGTKGNPPKGRWKLSEPQFSDFQDFCEAQRAIEWRIINDAVREFIDARLKAEPELRKRFEAARQERLGAASKVRPLRSVKDC